MANVETNTMVPFQARLIHGYPKGRSYKIHLIFDELVYFFIFFWSYGFGLMTLSLFLKEK